MSWFSDNIIVYVGNSKESLKKKKQKKKPGKNKKVQQAPRMQHK